MTASRGTDRQALAALLGWQDGLISRPQAVACGLTHDAIRRRIRPGGPWQRLLPDVYLALTGIPTAAQKAVTALLYAGPDSVLTGRAALRELGISKVAPEQIDVLIPDTRQRRSISFVVIHRTTQMPFLVRTDGPCRYTAPPRALADAARGVADSREARAIVAGAVQEGRCSLSFLAAELAAGPRRHSGFLRIVLDEVLDGVRSVAEGEFRELIIWAGLPRPRFNEPLHRADGTFLAIADAWWPEARVAAEVDSREWHLSPADWERTMARHNEMARHGIQVLHFSPGQIRREPRRVTAAIAGALRERGLQVAGSRWAPSP